MKAAPIWLGLCATLGAVTAPSGSSVAAAGPGPVALCRKTAIVKKTGFVEKVCQEDANSVMLCER